MTFLGKTLVFTLSIAAMAADKDAARFAPGPASSFPNKQTSAGVTIAAEAYYKAEKIQTAFGKAKPYENGVLPVLLVIQNDSGQTLSLADMKVEYVMDRTRVEATPAADLRYLRGGQKPKATSSPLPSGIPRVSRSKNPFDAWEFEGRAFSAKMLPPKESAHGFLYFQAGFRGASKIYVSGLKEAGSGKELFYFEIPLE